VRGEGAVPRKEKGRKVRKKKRLLGLRQRRAAKKGKKAK
jgi:hypothetical protein